MYRNAVQPIPDYGDEDDDSDATSSLPASKRQGKIHWVPDKPQQDYASSLEDVPPRSRSQSPGHYQKVLGSVHGYGTKRHEVPSQIYSPPRKTLYSPTATHPAADYEELPADYEELPADYDDDSEVADAVLTLPTAKVAGDRRGVCNAAFTEHTEVIVHVVAPPIQRQDAAGNGRQPHEGQHITAVEIEEMDMPALANKRTLGTTTTSAENANDVAGQEQILMAPEILEAADVGALLGRLTKDGHLLSNRPHHNQVRQQRIMKAHGSVDLDFDELYRQQKRKDGTQLLESSTVRLTGFQKWKFERAKKWGKSKSAAKEALSDFTIWNGAFKEIEGQFGSPVLAYFRFLKWLFLLDLLLALLVLGVVILPQVIMQPATFSEYMQDRAAQNPRFTGKFADQAKACSANYTAYVNGVINNSTVIESVLDFIQGTGWMEQTPVFIGFYFNRTYTNMLNSETVHYNMSVGYLLSILSYFLISLFLMVRFTAQGMKNRITSTDRFYKACNKVFCGWDFSLAEKKAVVFKHNQLYQEYIRDVDVQRRKEQRRNQSRTKKFQIILIRMLVNLVVVTVLGASGYLIYFMADASIKWLNRDIRALDPFLKLLVEFLPSLTITFLNFIVPLIFQKLVKLEGYSPTFEIKITIMRSVTLRLASVAVLVLGVGTRLLNCKGRNEACNTCPGVTQCWETYFGQQFYKLVLLDFVTVIIMTFCVQFPRKFIVDRFKNVKLFQMVGYQEFEIPKEVLDIVYTQTLCWIGGFLSPIIFCMTVIKMFLFFYIKKTALLNTCNPSTRLFRASNSQAFFMAMLLLSFVLCAIPVAFAIGRILPSKGCSPFRLYSTTDYYMFSAMMDLLAEWPGWLQNIISFVTSWTFYLPLIIIICLAIYFYVSVAIGKQKLIKLLLEQLALEGKDKQYLLTQVRKAITRGDFKKTV